MQGKFFSHVSFTEVETFEVTKKIFVRIKNSKPLQTLNCIAIKSGIEFVQNDLHLLRRSFAQISSTRVVEKQNYNRSVLVIIYVVGENFILKK